MKQPFDAIAIEAAVNAFDLIHIDLEASEVVQGLGAAWASLEARGIVRDASLHITGKTWEAFTNFGGQEDVNAAIIKTLDTL